MQSQPLDLVVSLILLTRQKVRTLLCVNPGPYPDTINFKILDMTAVRENSGGYGRVKLTVHGVRLGECMVSALSINGKSKQFKNLFMLSVRISSYGCTRVVWRARKMRKSCTRR